MAQNDLDDDVRLHATKTFEAVGNRFSKLTRPKRILIRVAIAWLCFILGFITCDIMNSVPTEGIIEKVGLLEGVGLMRFPFAVIALYFPHTSHILPI